MTRQNAVETIDALYATWGRALLRYAIAWIHNRAAGEDIVQEAFFSLYSKLAAGVAIDNPRAWTLTVVRHLAAKYQRDQARRPIARDVACDRMAASDAGFEADFASLEAFRNMLQLLSEREEEVLLLRMESLSYREIAGEMGITPGTVATLLSRALAKIKDAAAKPGHDAPSQFTRRNIGPRSLQ